MSERTYYLTTPLYYVNDVPHIGHAYTTIAADVLARWKRQTGVKTFLLTGTDEHGNKIAQAAEAAGLDPAAFTDKVVASFRTLWERLGITFDDFIRTTEPRHKSVVQAVFEKLHKQGDIYKGRYEGLYCTPCETYWAESELNEGKCPTCGRTVEKLVEDSYFFRLSAYQDKLLAHLEKHPEFLAPSSRAPEVLNFVKSGLRDFSVSRTRVRWGIPVPFDPGHTIYVWTDALMNYVSAIGYHPDGSAPGFNEKWPAEVHLIGKEIMRFHGVIWPVLLMALGLPLPKRVFAHGWWTVEGDKMSKSKGNVVDPHAIADEFGVDALRYFVLREVPFGSDGDFSRASLLSRYNAELANALGNLLNRTLNLVDKHNEARTPHNGEPSVLPLATTKEWFARFDAAMERLAFHEALEQILQLVNECNKFMEDRAPWKQVKTDKPAALASLHDVMRALSAVGICLAPFMPAASAALRAQLGEPAPVEDLTRRAMDGDLSLPEGRATRRGDPLFPRKDV